MRLVSVHADGGPHRIWERALPGLDPWSFVVEPGALVTEAEGSTWSSPYPVAALFWPQVYFQVFILLKEDATDYYCNVITPPHYNPVRREMQFVDLDIDVVRFGGRVEVRDFDEFEERNSRYPTEWVTGAVTAMDRLVQLAVAERGPFAPTTIARWREHVLHTGRL